MGKLELPPFDAPEAETEIVTGALTEYSGRGLALFQLAKAVELVVGLTLIAAFYLGGIGNPLDFFVKTLADPAGAGRAAIVVRPLPHRADRQVVALRLTAGAGAVADHRAVGREDTMKFRFAAMLSDIVESLFKRPITEKYPFERYPAPERLRGKLTWNPEKCTGCCLCNKDCPSNAIELITIDKKAKRFVMEYHADRCTYCAQCVQNCRFECLSMSTTQWELAALTKEPFTVYYGKDEDVQTVLTRFSEPKTLEPAPAKA